jgi:hypothetical protein
MRFVIVFTLATIANFLWGGYISAVSGKQAVRAATWSMAIAIVGGVIAINFVRAPVLLVSLAAGSFAGTYLSIVSDNGKAIPLHSGFFEKVVYSRPSLIKRRILARSMPRRQSRAQAGQSSRP